MIPDFAKKILKVVLAPVWRRVSYRIEIRLNPLRGRIADLESRLAQAEHLFGDINHQVHVLSKAARDLQNQFSVYVPSFVGAVAAAKQSGMATNALAQRLSDLEVSTHQHLQGLQSMQEEMSHRLASVEEDSATKTARQIVGPSDVPPPARPGVSPEEIAILTERLVDLETRLANSAQALQAHVDAELGAGVHDLNTTLSARIHSVVTQSDALGEQLLQVRRSLSEDVNDLWQFVRAHTERNGAVSHQSTTAPQ